MTEILKRAEEARRRKGGQKSKLSIENMLLLVLEYLREYRTYFHIAQDYGVHETTAIRIHRWVENVLVKDGTFSLPGKKVLLESNKKRYYSGKKKQHTMKAQVVIDKSSRKIICTAFSAGKRHDFKLFKESKTRI